MSYVTTRRALETVLARVPMHSSTANHLARVLHTEVIQKRKNFEPTVDAESLLASMHVIKELATGVNQFPKSALNSRLGMIQQEATRIIARNPNLPKTEFPNGKDGTPTQTPN